MRFKVSGNKKDIIAVVVKNAETARTISAGAPVFLANSGTNDGLNVITGVSLSQATQCTFFGFALTDISPGAYGESITFGFYDSARIAVATRSATSAVWASFVAASIGGVLAPVTGTGSAAAKPDQGMSQSATASITLNAMARIMTTWASITTQASDALGSALSGCSFEGVSSDNTIAFTTAKVFVKLM